MAVTQVSSTLNTSSDINTQDISTLKVRMTEQESVLSSLVSQPANSNAEIIGARNGYSTLGIRLDTSEALALSDKADTTALFDGLAIDVRLPMHGLTPAVGDGITDDSVAIKAIIRYAFDHHLSITYGSASYKVSGDNPCGLPKEIPNPATVPTDRNMNVIGNSAHFTWYPTLEDDVFAFVGYLRTSRWQDYRLTVVQPSPELNYGDVYGTNFGIAGAEHAFSGNNFDNIYIDGRMRNVISMDCTGGELQYHDDLTVFEHVQALGYKKFYFTSNSNSVAITFDNCSTLDNVDGAIDFHIAGPWAGGLRVLNHHFTIMDCDGATMFKNDAPSHSYATIYCENPRVEVRETATNWKYFDMTTGILNLNDIHSVNYPIYSSANIYGIARNDSRVTFKDSTGVYTPINLIGETSPGEDSALEVLEFDHCSFVNGDTANARQAHPLINYCRADGSILPSRYNAIASIYNWGNVVVKYCTGRWGDYTRWLDSYVLSNGDEMVIDALSKVKAFSYKNITGATVNYIATKCPIVMPCDIVIEKIEYRNYDFALIDNIKCEFPNGDRVTIEAPVTTATTSLIGPNNPLCLKAGVKLQLHAFNVGVEVDEVSRGITASQMVITYRLPQVMSELYNVTQNTLA